MKKSLISNLKKLSNHFGRPVILVYYHPKIENPMRLGDEFWLDAFLKYSKAQNPIIFLYGSGGNLKTGITMSYILNHKFKKYETFAPFSCCSSLIYMLLKSNKLYLSKYSYISQIDPILEYNKEGTKYDIRLIKSLEDNDKNIREKAVETYNIIRDRVQKILFEESPSLINKDDRESFMTDYEKIEQVVDLFFNKKEHFSELDYNELKTMNLNVKQVEEEVISTSREILNNSKKMIEKEEGTLLIASSEELNKYGEGILIRKEDD